MPDIAHSTSKVLGGGRRSVKGMIVDSGIKLADLAFAASMSASNLSHYLCGRQRGADGRQRIWLVYRALSGHDVTYEAFWAPLDTGLERAQSRRGDRRGKAAG